MNVSNLYTDVRLILFKVIFFTVPLVDILAHFHSVRMYPGSGRLSDVELLSALFLSIMFSNAV
jgi:hypothetical protein